MEKRILTVQDISCVGQCSLTVALPILSSFGLETAVLPTAVLSNHTGAPFTSWSFLDLTGEMSAIEKKWEEHSIDFDVIYTGYLGSKEQTALVEELADKRLKRGGKLIVDPVLGDNGKLYAGFDDNFASSMRALASRADVILPNITEACVLSGIEYKAGVQTQDYIEKLMNGLVEMGAKSVIITGVSLEERMLGAAVYDGEKIEYRFENLIPRMSHGTGDVFASAAVGALTLGSSLADAAAFACKFVVSSITATSDHETHTYGVRFEKALPLAVEYIKSKNQ